MFDRSFHAEPYTAAGTAALPGGCAGAPHSGAATADMAGFRLDGRRPRPPNARGQSRHAMARYRRRIAPPLNLIAQLPTRYIPMNPMNIGCSLLIFDCPFQGEQETGPSNGCHWTAIGLDPGRRLGQTAPLPTARIEVLPARRLPYRTAPPWTNLLRPGTTWILRR